VAAAFQEYRRGLQGKLNMLTNSVIQIDRWNLVCSFARTMFKRDREIVFPLAVSRGARVICDHRRTTLPKRNARHGCDEHRDR
jgi:hypothetical protein